MNSLVVGFGIVGKAQAHFLQHMHHRVESIDKGTNHLTTAPTFDYTFICTPERETENALVSVTKNLGTKAGLVVIKSSTLPGTTKRLMTKYNRHLCHNPEFLREQHLFEDVMTPSKVIIGQCCNEHGTELENLYSPLNCPIYRTDPTTSELSKLVSNTLRANMISYWNEIHALATRLGISTAEIVSLVNPQKTIHEWEGGNWGIKFFGLPFGGKCLPKDLDQLIAAFKAHGIDAPLLEGVLKRNNITQTARAKGMNNQ